MDDSYKMEHRPGNPLEFPNEVATLDKMLQGDYFPDDILDRPEAYYIFNSYPTDKELINKLKAAQNNPDAIITIYRGAPSNGTLNTGDWVSLSKEYAMQYAGAGGYSDNPNSMLYEYKVKAKDLSFDGDSIYEYGYWGEETNNYENVWEYTDGEIDL